MSYTNTLCLLFIGAAVSAGGAYYCYDNWDSTQTHLKTETENEAAQQATLSRAMADLKSMQTETEPAQRFLDAWKPYFDATQNDPVKILGKALSSAEKEIVSVIDKTTDAKKQYLFLDDTTLVCTVTLKCQGEYSHLFNLLGSLEKEFPQARFDNAIFSAADLGASATQLNLIFYIPVTSELGKTK